MTETYRHGDHRVRADIWARIALTDNDCWLWTGTTQGRDKWQYGKVKYLGKVTGSHRHLYEMLVGPIPEGHQIDHLCRNTLCQNPAHMEAVTQQENIRRGKVGEYCASKTHCPRNHPYVLTNTYKDSKGARCCKTCRALRGRERSHNPVEWDEFRYYRPDQA